MEVLEKISQIVASQLNVDAASITPDTRFEDLNADSLDVVEVIMALEDEFGIAIPDEVAEQIKNIGAAADYIRENI